VDGGDAADGVFEDKRVLKKSTFQRRREAALYHLDGSHQRGVASQKLPDRIAHVDTGFVEIAEASHDLLDGAGPSKDQ